MDNYKFIIQSQEARILEEDFVKVAETKDTRAS